jgi:hypothetical protein
MRKEEAEDLLVSQNSNIYICVIATISHTHATCVRK